MEAVRRVTGRVQELPGKTEHPWSVGVNPCPVTSSMPLTLGMVTDLLIQSYTHHGRWPCLWTWAPLLPNRGTLQRWDRRLGNVRAENGGAGCSCLRLAVASRETFEGVLQRVHRSSRGAWGHMELQAEAEWSLDGYLG